MTLSGKERATRFERNRPSSGGPGRVDGDYRPWSDLWPGSGPSCACPWRRTLTIVAPTMAYSRSGSSEPASNIRLKTSALAQSR